MRQLINVSERVYRALANLKNKGESFNTVIQHLYRYYVPSSGKDEKFKAIRAEVDHLFIEMKRLEVIDPYIKNEVEARDKRLIQFIIWRSWEALETELRSMKDKGDF